MKLPRKLKKRISKFFGSGTYRGIVRGYLMLEKYHNNRGVVVKYTGKEMNDGFYYAYTRHPHVIFPDVKFYNN